MRNLSNSVSKPGRDPAIVRSATELPDPAEPLGAPDGRPRVLMLGMGWFPATLGGLDRYFRALFEQLPEAAGVVLGPAEDAPASIDAVARQDSSLPRRLLAFWLAARRAGRRADVVDAHFALYAAAPLLLGALRTRPAVFHFHGPWAEENIAAGDTSGVKLTLRRAVERRALHHADAHVVLSCAFRRLLVERYGVRPWNVHVWPPGVALDVFTPGDRSRSRARLDIDPSAFVAVCARRLVPRMGIDGLLDAWGQIEEQLTDGSVLLLVGDGPLRDRLAERAARPPLAGRVRVLGRVSDEDLVDFYRCADVAVVPTIAFEGFGLVALEAAACGTPSIVSDVGGLPEAAMGLDPSLIVAPGDTEALGARLRGAARGALPARSATRRHAERFGWPAVAERHRELYRRLAAGEPDERPRVVYLDHVARLSGGEIALLRLLPHLRRVNAHVILGEDGPFATRLQQAGISVEVLPIDAAARELRKDTVRVGGPAPMVLLSTLTYVARLALRLRRLQPDLVHTNSLKAGVYGSLAARAAGVPVIWHARDRIAEDYLPRPAVRLVRSLVRHLPDGVIANSAATLDTLGETGRSGRSALRCVIPDSVEAPAHLRAPGSHGGTTFGMLGRIAPWKGQDLFLRAFAAAFPGGTERAVIVGTAMFGEQAYERELPDLAARLGLAERVEFRGFREDVWQELESFDVLVHASVTPEPFGQVVLEGMAAGLAVIAPDEGGPATMIADGETGRLFRGRDSESLAAAMRALREDPAERERLGTAARRAVERYHPDAVAEQLQRVYDRVAREARRGARRRIRR
ncbi:MAG TPA: glycosyltransferase family 4 protein [Solirubrobacteraceae bacterium]|nr:glycosyltransferase family 4 protein [Solirubrobacteraceae bacterium]